MYALPALPLTLTLSPGMHARSVIKSRIPAIWAQQACFIRGLSRMPYFREEAVREKATNVGETFREIVPEKLCWSRHCMGRVGTRVHPM